jgi:hypothetical protein
MTTTTVTGPTKVKTQDKDQIYDQKLYQITADLKPFRISQLRRMDQNSFAVIEFLYSKMREGNLKPASRASTIDRLCQFSLFHKNKPSSTITLIIKTKFSNNLINFIRLRMILCSGPNVTLIKNFLLRWQYGLKHTCIYHIGHNLYNRNCLPA